MAAFLAKITEVLAWVISSIGSVATAFLGETGALKDLLPFLAIPLGFAVVGICVGYVRSMIKVN